MTGTDDNLQSGEFRPQGLAVRAFLGPHDPSYRVVIWAFLVASLSHLWLEDASHADWMPANAIYVLGLLLLVFGRGAAGWLASAVGLAIPLLFLRDQLTQSALLLMIAVAGTVFTSLRSPDTTSFLRVVRGLTLVTYAFAGWHKLNRDFFDPAVGCASYGFDEIATYYHLDPAIFAGFAPAHAPLAVALELSIPLAYLLGRRHLARLLAVVFHIPLTMTMAPAFAFVMAAGHAAFLTEEDRLAYRQAWVKRRVPILLLGTTATAASLALHGALPELTMIPREWALWVALGWSIAVIVTGRAARPTWERPTRTWFADAFVIAFAFNCSTPYLGLQYQHAAAMLSNLRIDQGCWNHFVVPEALRLRDDYVRVEAVSFGAPGRLPEYEDIVRDQLWSPPQFVQMRRNWCRAELRPLAMSGTFRGRQWRFDDLCDADEPWPFSDDGVLGTELFGQFLRFQKNLARECPQACIH